MAVACASRFAVLKLEDDEVLEKAAEEKAKQTAKKSAAAKTTGQTETKAKPKKKKKNPSDVAELQNLAFGGGSSKPKKNNNHGQNTQRSVNPKQWEEWKKKDNEFVSETYEQDLQQALLLSKLDYEEKKEIYDSFQKENGQSGKSTNIQKKKKKNNQKKEKSSMSLDEFQSLLPSQIETGNYGRGRIDALEDFSTSEKLAPIHESDFFDKIEEDAEKIIMKEQRQEMYKKPQPSENKNKVVNSRLQQQLEMKDEEIRLLNEEIERLKEEIKDIKSKNKRLCGILTAGEMKEKTEIILQIEQLTSVKDELNEQLNEFHVALEQERSKVHALQMELKKCQATRKDRRDSK